MARKPRTDPEYLAKLKEWQKARYIRKREEIIEQNTKYRESKKQEIKYRLTRMLNAAATRARNKGLDFDIDLEFLEYLWKKQDGKCSVSGRNFDLGASDKRVNINAPSLDRIDSDKGYVKDNLRLVTWQINCAISEYGLENFLTVCQDVIDFNRG